MSERPRRHGAGVGMYAAILGMFWSQYGKSIYFWNRLDMLSSNFQKKGNSADWFLGINVPFEPLFLSCFDINHDPDGPCMYTTRFNNVFELVPSRRHGRGVLRCFETRETDTWAVECVICEICGYGWDFSHGFSGFDRFVGRAIMRRVRLYLKRANILMSWWCKTRSNMISFRHAFFLKTRVSRMKAIVFFNDSLHLSNQHTARPADTQ